MGGKAKWGRKRPPGERKRGDLELERKGLLLLPTDIIFRIVLPSVLRRTVELPWESYTLNSSRTKDISFDENVDLSTHGFRVRAWKDFRYQIDQRKRQTSYVHVHFFPISGVSLNKVTEGPQRLTRPPSKKKSVPHW